MESKFNDEQWASLTETQKAERLAGVVVSSVVVFCSNSPYPAGVRIAGTVDGREVVVEYAGTASFMGQFPERMLARQAARENKLN